MCFFLLKEIKWIYGWTIAYQILKHNKNVDVFIMANQKRVLLRKILFVRIPLLVEDVFPKNDCGLEVNEGWG